MKKLVLVPFAAVAFTAACGDSPAGPADDGELLREVVLTLGAPTPARVWNPGPPLLSDLGGAASVGGSEADAVSLKPADCDDGSSQQVTITFTITGRQANPASFDVHTNWVYDGTNWTGSVPTTVNVATREAQDAATVINIGIDVVNNSAANSGTSSFTIVPFNVVTSSPAALTVTQGNVTIHAAFAACPVTNTPPTMVLPTTIIEIEATSSNGAEVDPLDYVTANDLEDGDLTGAVVCVPSAGTFNFADHVIECSVEDSGGLTDEGSFTIRVQDTMAPVFTQWPQSQVDLVAADIDGARLDIESLGIEARDYGPDGAAAGEISPPVAISCMIGTADADGYEIEIGQTVTVRCAATDDRDNRDAANDIYFDVFVGLDLSTCGFGAPLRNMPGPYSAHKRNSTVPHKVCAPRYADESLATDLAGGLKLKLEWQSGTANGVAEAEDPAAGSTVWRWVEEDEHYIFNAKTANTWSLGSWKTTVEYAGIVLAETRLVLNK